MSKVKIELDQDDLNFVYAELVNSYEIVVDRAKSEPVYQQDADTLDRIIKILEHYGAQL